MTHIDHAYVPIGGGDAYYYVATFTSYLRATRNPGHSMWDTTPHLLGKCCVRTDMPVLSARISTDMSLTKFVGQYRLVVKCYT